MWLAHNQKISKQTQNENYTSWLEHFSIRELTKGSNDKSIKKIYLIASGGPFLNKPLKYFNSIKADQAIKHPKWKMGKKYPSTHQI